jgi:flagellin
MVNGVNGSSGVLSALRELQTSRRQLEEGQARLASGLQIATARDAPAIYQSAESLRTESSSLHVVASSLGRAESISDIAIAAGEQISSLLTGLRGTAARALATDLTPEQRQAYVDQFQAQIEQIEAYIQNAVFDDANVLDGSRPGGVTFVADAEASQTLTLAGRNLLPGGPVLTVAAYNDLSTPGGAEAAVRAIDESIANLGKQLTDMSKENRRIRDQIGFVTRLADAMAAGVGRLVDADLALESALIQALQVKQSLSGESVGIVNRAPQSLLSLLRSG